MWLGRFCRAVQKSVFAGIVVLAFSTGPAPAQDILTPEEFARAYLEAAGKAEPEIRFRKVDTDTYRASTADGAEIQIYLGNAYLEYRNSPDEKDDIIQRHVGSLAILKNEGDAGISPDQIVPVVRDVGYLTALPWNDADDRVVYEPIAADLVMLFAFDLPDRIMSMQERHIGELGLDGTDLAALAKGNLGRLYGQNLQVLGGDGFYVFDTGTIYDSSMIFLDLWSKDNFPVEGEIVVFVPARNFLIVTGTEEAEGLAQARKMSAEVYSSEAYPLSETGLVLRNGEWVAFTN
jgi:uncharacterized protein YtpQ (UPF0354 family)